MVLFGIPSIVLSFQRRSCCGLEITSDGITLDLKHLSGLLKVPKPATGQDLQQLYCVINWIRNSIPDLAALTNPLLMFKNGHEKRFGQKKGDLAKT